jgi:casein kinase I family protein HRR25
MVDIGSNNITSSKNVFTGTNIASGEKIEIRVASGKDGRQLRKTASICKALAGCSGFPFIRDVYKAGDSYTMVYDALGRRLEDLTTGASLKTCLLIFYQLITRLEFMHGRLLVHGGIRPGDLRMGYGMRGNQVVLTNFRTSSSDKKFASIGKYYTPTSVLLD